MPSKIISDSSIDKEKFLLKIKKEKLKYKELLLKIEKEKLKSKELEIVIQDRDRSLASWRKFYSHNAFNGSYVCDICVLHCYDGSKVTYCFDCRMSLCHSCRDLYDVPLSNDRCSNSCKDSISKVAHLAHPSSHDARSLYSSLFD